MHLVRLLLLLGLISFATFESRLAASEPSTMRYSKPEVRKELVAVVEAQLAAFRAKDFVKAQTFAVRQMREQLTAGQFATMITRGYPVIATNKRAEIGLPMDDGETAAMTVEVVGKDDRTVSYRYSLMKEADGWRIAGVVENKASRATDA